MTHLPCMFCRNRRATYGMAGVRRCGECKRLWAVENGRIMVWRDDQFQFAGWGELSPPGCLVVFRWEKV